MDFNNGLYVFNGVPGLDVSKGERIVKALEKLQAKIKYLEQIRESEKESSKDQADNEKELTFTDIQFKLLVLQLQYMRTMLRRNSNVPNENIDTESEENQNCCKETQTGVSLYEPHQEARTGENVYNLEDQSNDEALQYSLPTREAAKPPGAESNHDNLPEVNIPVSSNNTPLHYHLKFDDVPFILGASSSASHNIVANVQNIIAMMKTHNKALCGTKHQAPRNPALKTSSQDTNKIMKNLSEELTELQKKQADLIKKIDFAQKGNHFGNAESRSKSCDNPELHNKHEEQSSGNYLRDGNAAANFNQKKSFPGDKGRDITKKEKHAVPINRIKSNLPQVTRQRLLRSIQEFKTHLSEEDMSWV